MENDLYNLYLKNIQSEDETVRDNAFEQAEESHYFDGIISYEQFSNLQRIYKELEDTNSPMR